jgi:hypothetical protein
VQVQWGFLSSVLDWLLSSVLVVVIAADESQGLVRRRSRVIGQVAEEAEDTRVRH